MNEEILKDKLRILASDPIALQALKMIFAERIEKEKPEIGILADNSILGEKFRAYEVAKTIVNKSFLDILNYKVTPKSINNFNKER